MSAILSRTPRVKETACQGLDDITTIECQSLNPIVTWEQPVWNEYLYWIEEFHEMSLGEDFGCTLYDNFASIC